MARDDAAFGERRRAHELRIVGGDAERLRCGGNDVLVVERPQVQSSATRANGWQQASGRVTDHQQQGARRRFFKNLEQRVGAFAIEFFRAVDDADAPAALACGRAEKLHRLAHVGDRDFSTQLAAVADGALQHQKIAVPLRHDAARDRVVRPERDSVVAACTSGAAGSGCASTNRAMR